MWRLLALMMITSSTALFLQRSSICSSMAAARRLSVQINRGGYKYLASRYQIYFPFNHPLNNRLYGYRHKHQINSLSATGETMSVWKKAKTTHNQSEDEGIPVAEEQTTEEYVNSLPTGLSKGYHIVAHATVPLSGFSMEQINEKLKDDEIRRLDITQKNVTVPVALLMLFPETFETLTRARKECRRRKILVLRCPDDEDATDGRVEIDFDPQRMIIGRVIDRVMAGDTIAIQTRTTNGGYAESMKHDKDPPFHLPVVYQDDHIAVVNKPEGVVVFGHKNGGYGRNTVKSALPYVLDPPKIGTMSILWNPMPVHRIDKATSGLLLVAKTKPAMVHLSHQFRERTVKKTYTAIVNGIPLEPKETSITSAGAKNLGVCIETADGTNEDKLMWQLIDKDLEEQSAVTIWRTLGKARLGNAVDETVTMVQLKPKTGRFHQLRRHLAWVCNCPIIGDSAYDGAGRAKSLRENGMFLSSNKVTFEHPYFKTIPNANNALQSNGRDKVSLTEDENGTVLVNVEIDLPKKFNDMMKGN